MYIRLSREDGDKQESESIGNQRKIIERYLKEQDLNIVDEYVDDGVSGTTFDRPEFNRLITDIENQKINMVITKDLSRLGRDYIKTGYYIENYFPENQVRYVSILDGIESYLFRLIDKIEIDKNKNVFISFNFAPLNTINENIDEFIEIEEILQNDKLLENNIG